jgi:hypothetical protein
MGAAGCNDIASKKEDGKLLYETLLHRVHNSDFENMYEYFKVRVERLEIYGDTLEKQLVNYCAFKRDMVLTFYK